MERSTLTLLLAALLAATGGLAVARADDNERQELREEVVEIQVAPNQVAPNQVAPNQVAPNQVAPNQVAKQVRLGQPSFLFGIAMLPIDETLRAQLNIEGGVVVGNVLPRSPAKEAGVEPHDVIIQFGDKKVTNPAELSAAVTKNGTEEVEVRLIRVGKQKTVKVSPRKFDKPVAGAPSAAENHKQTQQMFAELMKKHGDHFADRMLWVEPLILDASKFRGAAGHQLPSNVSVTIQKSGEEPAKIKIKIDDKEWNITEDKLDELPKEVQEHVRPFLNSPLGSRVNGLTLRMNPGFTAKPSGNEATRVTEIHRAANAKESEVKADALEQIRKSHEQLLKAVKQLEKEIAELKDGEK